MLYRRRICVKDYASKESRDFTPSSPVAASVRRAEKEQRSSGQIYFASLRKRFRTIGFEQHLKFSVIDQDQEEPLSPA